MRTHFWKCSVETFGVSEYYKRFTKYLCNSCRLVICQPLRGEQWVPVSSEKIASRRGCCNLRKTSVGFFG